MELEKCDLKCGGIEKMRIKLRSVFYLLALINCFISCSNQPDLEGLWQNTADYDGEDNAVQVFEGVYLSFDADSVIVISVSLRSSYDIDTLPYTVTDSTLIIGEAIYNYSYDDSLTLHYPHELGAGHSMVFKKFDDDKKAKSLEQLKLDGFYALVRENVDTLYHFEFFNDSAYQYDAHTCSGYPFGQWSVFEINGISFFDTYDPITLMRIDSCSENEIKLDAIIDSQWKYSLVRYVPPLIREKLVGNWNITGAYSSNYPTINDTSLYEITSINVDTDSLSINGENSKLKWLLSMDERSILFPDIDYYTAESSWELVELSDYKMTITLYADHKMKAVLTFLKDPYEGDNPFFIHKQL